MLQRGVVKRPSGEADERGELLMASVDCKDVKRVLANEGL